MTTSIAPPPGRKDLTEFFIAHASKGQIDSLRNKGASMGSSGNPLPYMIYGAYDPTLDPYKADQIDDSPIRNLMWFGKFEVGEPYAGGAQFVVDSNHWDIIGYVSTYYQVVKSYDYGHEVFTRLAPPEYRDIVYAEQAELDRLEEDYEDDADYDSDQDLF